MSLFAAASRLIRCSFASPDRHSCRARKRGVTGTTPPTRPHPPAPSPNAGRGGAAGGRRAFPRLLHPPSVGTRPLASLAGTRLGEGGRGVRANLAEQGGEI